MRQILFFSSLFFFFWGGGGITPDLASMAFPLWCSQVKVYMDNHISPGFREILSTILCVPWLVGKEASELFPRPIYLYCTPWPFNVWGWGWYLGSGYTPLTNHVEVACLAIHGVYYSLTEYIHTRDPMSMVSHMYPPPSGLLRFTLVRVNTNVSFNSVKG